jgi:hypothetical protein
MCGRAAAQQNVVAQGEIIRPQFSLFTAGTTVSVPDRGGMYLGGIESRREGRSEFGPGGRNHGIGFEARGQHADVRVEIFIPEEREEELAREAASRGDLAANDRSRGSSEPYAYLMRKSPSDRASAAKGDARGASSEAKRLVTDARRLQATRQFVQAAQLWEQARTKYWAEIDRNEANRELMELRKRPEVLAALHETKAAEALAQGKSAEQQGKPRVARVYYQTAARLAPAPSAALAEQRLDALAVRLAEATPRPHGTR